MTELKQLQRDLKDAIDLIQIVADYFDGDVIPDIHRRRVALAAVELLKRQGIKRHEVQY